MLDAIYMLIKIERFLLKPTFCFQYLHIVIVTVGMNLDHCIRIAGTVYPVRIFEESISQLE